MANRIKGITIELDGDSSKLTKALRKADEEARKTQDDLKYINKALKLDPTNVELIEQKQRKLKTAIEETTKKLELQKKAQKEATDPAQYELFTRQIVFTENALKGYTKAYEQATAVSAAFSSKLAEVQGALTKVETVTGSVAERTEMASKVAAGVLAGLSVLAIKAMKSADEIKTLAQQTGLTTDEIQKFQYASELVDVSVDSMTGALSKLTRNMASTSGSTRDAFMQLGISVTDVNGHMRNASDVFYEVLEALGKIQNETERDQVSMELFGRSAMELAGIVDDGGRALKAYGEEAEAVGAVWSTGTLEALTRLNDQFDRLKNMAMGSIGEPLANALDSLTPAIQSFMDILSSLFESIGNLDGETIKVGASILGIIAIISPLMAIINGVSGAILGVLNVLPGVLSFISGIDPKLLVLVATLGVLAKLIVDIENAWGDMSGLERVVSILGALTIAATSAAIAMGAFSSAASMGMAAVAIVAGIAAITAAVNSANKRAGGNVSASGIMTSSPGSYGSGSAVINNYNNSSTTNNYASKQPQPINVNIDGKIAAMALYDPLQDVGFAHGPSWTK